MKYTSTIQIQSPINKSNQRNQDALINTLFDDYSKLLVIRLDFYLKKDYADINTYDYMNQSFIQLRNNIRFNRLFEHYITYSAKLEYGEDRRWHFHVLFFFDGQKVKNDYLLAQNIGEYWVTTITRGLGQYYSANMNREQYKTFAVGMIGYQETNKINDLKAAVNYLAKETVLSSNMPMRDASGKVYRSYRQGQYKPKHSHVGRPRKYRISRPAQG